MTGAPVGVPKAQEPPETVEPAMSMWMKGRPLPRLSRARRPETTSRKAAGNWWPRGVREEGSELQESTSSADDFPAMKA